MTAHVELRPGAYADSVALMLASRALAERPGVDHALLAMATPLNLDLAAAAGYTVPSAAGPGDLLVAVRTRPDADLDVRLAVDAELRATSNGPAAAEDGATAAPRTVGGAARRQHRGGAPTAGVALISVPGEHAVVEAVDAIEEGLHPMVFSDHVGLDEEVALKELAGLHGLLVMGPDCGTAVIDGVALGFANVVPPGPVGVVAASGTGAQQICCLLADAGIGVRHVLGVGGRDLSAAVAGRSTLHALTLLDADPGIELIVVIAKPSDPAVTARVRTAAASLDTPSVMGLVGQSDLTATVRRAAAALGAELDEPATWPTPAARRSGQLRGLFAGGTLAAEAVALATPVLGPINHDPAHDGHLAADLGDDRYTAGRPHPMIDQSVRLDLIAAEASRPGSHVLLLDVVLGHGAHPDPAAELGPAILRARDTAEARGDDLAVVLTLIGTADDPQRRDEQATRLQAAGASVFAANAEAVRAALDLLEPRA